MINWVLCHLFGHKWQFYPTKRVEVLAGYQFFCSRCLKEGKVN